MECHLIHSVARQSLRGISFGVLYAAAVAMAVHDRRMSTENDMNASRAYIYSLSTRLFVNARVWCTLLMLNAFFTGIS